MPRQKNEEWTTGEERGMHIENRKARSREALVMVKGGFLEKRLSRSWSHKSLGRREAGTPWETQAGSTSVGSNVWAGQRWARGLGAWAESRSWSRVRVRSFGCILSVQRIPGSAQGGSWVCLLRGSRWPSWQDIWGRREWDGRGDRLARCDRSPLSGDIYPLHCSTAPLRLNESGGNFLLVRPGSFPSARVGQKACLPLWASPAYLPAMQETRFRFLGREDPLEKEMATSLQYSCLENPMDRGAWWRRKSWTRLSDETTTTPWVFQQKTEPYSPITPLM